MGFHEGHVLSLFCTKQAFEELEHCWKDWSKKREEIIIRFTANLSAQMLERGEIKSWGFMGPRKPS